MDKKLQKLEKNFRNEMRKEKGSSAPEEGAGVAYVKERQRELHKATQIAKG